MYHKLRLRKGIKRERREKRTALMFESSGSSRNLWTFLVSSMARESRLISVAVGDLSSTFCSSSASSAHERLISTGFISANDSAVSVAVVEAAVSAMERERERERLEERRSKDSWQAVVKRGIK